MSKALATIKQSLQSDSMVQALRDAVPITAAKFLTAERITKIVTTALDRSPKLLECEPRSILRSVIEIVQLGLEPGGPLGHAYLVPYGKQCTAILGYRGLIALARRSGSVESVYSEIIYEGDEYTLEYGSDPKLVHKPKLGGQSGPAIAAYCVAKFVGGGQHIEVMTAAQIDGIRARSKASGSGPWVTDWAEMARKTVVRRASKYWPLATEEASLIAQAIDVDARNDFVESTCEIVADKSSRVDKLAAKLEAPKSSEWDDVGPPALTEDESAEMDRAARGEP